MTKQWKLADTGICLLLGLLLCCIHAQIIRDCSHPFVFADEAGYWTNAAVMAGYDWSGVSGWLSWYSYGYSFVLAVLMRLFSDTAMLYQAALVLNVVMIAGVYFLYVRILKAIFPELKYYALCFAAFAASLYMPYQVQSGVAWSETIILFVMVLMTFLVLRMVQHPTYLNTAALGLFSAYSYMIHNRCIGVAASAMLIVLLAAMLNKIKRRHLFTFSGVLLAGLLADRLIRRYLEGVIWENGRPAGNDMGSTLEKVKAAFTSISGLKTLLSLLLSQSFASFTSAMGLSVIGLLVIVTFLFPRFVDLCKNRKNAEQMQKLSDGRFFVYLFALCSFVTSLCITSTFMLWYDRIDQVVYTRYFDMTVGILIAVGICQAASAVSEQKNAVLFALLAPLLFLGANRAGVLAAHLETDAYNRIASPSGAWFFLNYHRDYFHYAMLALLLLGLSLTAVILLKKYRNLCICLVSVGSVVFSCITAETAKDTILTSQKDMNDDVGLFQRIENDGTPLYILENCGGMMWLGQYILMDRGLTTIHTMSEAPADAFVITEASDIFSLPEYVMLDCSEDHLLLSSNPETTPTDRTLPLSFMNTFGSDIYDAGTDTISDDDVHNFLCYGPYFPVPEGNYTFTLQFSASDVQTESIGYAQVVSGGETYDRTELTADLFAENTTASVTLSPVMETDTPDVEIVVFLYDPMLVDLQLDKITFRKEY